MPLPPVPGSPALPKELADQIEASTARFAERFSPAMRLVAISQGWIEDYKRELTERVRAAYLFGRQR